MSSCLFNYGLVFHVFSNIINSKHLKITVKIFNLFRRRLLQFKKALIISSVKFHSFHSFENVISYIFFLFFAIMDEIQEHDESHQHESFPET